MLEEAHTVAVFQSLSSSSPTLLPWPHTVLVIQLLISDGSAEVAPDLQPQSSGTSEEIVLKSASSLSL